MNRTFGKVTLFALAGAILLTATLGGCHSVPPRRTFPAAATLPAQMAFPDPLRMFDGNKVTSASQWRQARRPELQTLFEHYIYGRIPFPPAAVRARFGPEYRDFLDGQATLKLVTLETGRNDAPRIDLMLVVPNARRGPAPVFLAMNFCGNHALTADPRVPLTRGWLRNTCQGCTNNAATEAARGSQAKDWPLAEIVRRGYALASFYSGDVDSDRSDVSDGLYAWLAAQDATDNNPTNRGTLAAWAWGFHRCVDYLVTDPDLDARRIAALGHSRNGKTALLAAAFDERIAMVFPHQAGCGGTAPSRTKTGETVKAINDRFPHWFNAQFKEFNDAPERLPVDQHCLIALCAPRPVLLSNAAEDLWANPAGQFEMLQAASPVYHLLGVEGLAAKTMPPLGELADSRLGYYLRGGKHSMTAGDWQIFLDFADKQFGQRGK